MKALNFRLSSAFLGGMVLLAGYETASAGFWPVGFAYNVSSESRTPLFPEGDPTLGSVFVNSMPGQVVPFSIPMTGNNEWTGPGQNHMPDPSYSGWYTLDIPVHRSGIRSVMTLINQHWTSGEPARLGFIDGSGAIQHTELLVPNRDIRDWNTQTGGTIDAACAQEVVTVSPGPFGAPCVMDMQVHELPSYFWAEGNELATIRVVDHAVWMSHQLILSGVTVSEDLVELPEPSAFSLLVLGGLGMLRRAQRGPRLA